MRIQTAGYAPGLRCDVVCCCCCYCCCWCRRSHGKEPAGRRVVSLLREGIDPRTSLRLGVSVPRFSLLDHECGGSFSSKSAAALPCRVHILHAQDAQAASD